MGLGRLRTHKNSFKLDSKTYKNIQNFFRIESFQLGIQMFLECFFQKAGPARILSKKLQNIQNHIEFFQNRVFSAGDLGFFGVFLFESAPCKNSFSKKLDKHTKTYRIHSESNLFSWRFRICWILLKFVQQILKNLQKHIELIQNRVFSAGDLELFGVLSQKAGPAIILSKQI